MMANRYFAIPMVGYFDDFASIARKAMGKDAMGVSDGFFRLLGFQMKRDKSHVGSAVVFLGLLGRFPCNDRGLELPISTPEGKRAKRPSLLSAYPTEGRIPTDALESC